MIKGGNSIIKSGRTYKLVDPAERCPECHQSAGDLGCKTLMSFGQHKAAHKRPNAHNRSIAPLIAPKGKRLGRPRKTQIIVVPAHAAPNGDVISTIQGAMKDVQKSMLLLQFAALLPRVSVERAENMLANLAKGTR